MVCREFPDNSVVCHARRLAKLPQDNFVSGRCSASTVGPNAPFLPRHLQRGLVLLQRAVARHELLERRDATQLPYEPFADPSRAAHEEFGDLLAEGLYALIGEASDPELGYDRLIERADWQFWYDSIGARHDQLTEITGELRAVDKPEVRSARRSLEAAGRQLQFIRPDTCVAFLRAWQEDLKVWNTYCQRLGGSGATRRGSGPSRTSRVAERRSGICTRDPSTDGVAIAAAQHAQPVSGRDMRLSRYVVPGQRLRVT